MNPDFAILSINNPPGFVSTANLTSASSVLLHPRCRGGTRSRAEPWGVVGDACWLAPGRPCCFFSAHAGRQATLSFPVWDSEALTDIFLELPHHSHCQRHTPSPPPCPRVLVPPGQEFSRAGLILGEIRGLLGFVAAFSVHLHT